MTSATLAAITDVIIRRLRDDVAALRGVPAPTGPPYAPPGRRALRQRRSAEVADPGEEMP
jgi:hypothetical protein